jgi:hypothetical protein
MHMTIASGQAPASRPKRSLPPDRTVISWPFTTRAGGGSHLRNSYLVVEYAMV